jgi:hypothetical protein
MAVKETYSLDKRELHAYSAGSCRKRFLGSGEIRGKSPNEGERVGEI